MGADAAVRVDANGLWSVDEAVVALERLAPFDLQYAEQPCRTVDELAELRRRIAGLGVRIAADESVRKASDPLAVARAGRCRRAGGEGAAARRDHRGTAGHRRCGPALRRLECARHVGRARDGGVPRRGGDDAGLRRRARDRRDVRWATSPPIRCCPRTGGSVCAASTSRPRSWPGSPHRPSGPPGGAHAWSASTRCSRRASPRSAGAAAERGASAERAPPRSAAERRGARSAPRARAPPACRSARAVTTDGGRHRVWREAMTCRLRAARATCSDPSAIDRRDVATARTLARPAAGEQGQRRSDGSVPGRQGTV